MLNGKLATRQDPGSVTETRTYDANDRLTKNELKTGTATTATYQYGYDAAGQLASDTTTDPLVSAQSRTYGYDSVGQLASRTTGSVVANWTATSAGVLSGVPGAALTTNSAEQVTKYTPTSGAATTFTSTALGSRASATTASTPAVTTNYSYSTAGKLIGATTGSTTTTYIADGDGLRQSLTRGSTTSKFLWDTSSALPLLLKDETYTYIYGPDASPVEAINTSTSTASYLHEDLIGSVRLAQSTAGAVVAVNEYDAYGAAGAHSGTNFTIGYSGNWTDSTTKLVYLRARDYDTTTGQFLQVDPAINLTRQPYAYAHNDPLARTDPTGLCDGIPGTPRDRTCTANDYFWSSDSQSAMWGNIGNNFANIAYGTADTITSGLGVSYLFGVPSLTEMWRHALVPDIECYTPTNGFYAFGAIWTGFATGGLARGLGLGAARATTGVVNEAGIAANQAAGNAARDVIAASHPGSEIEQTFNTALGARRVDVVTQNLVGIESKVGRTSLTGTTSAQIAKDVWLLQNNELANIQWVFTRSAVTGKVGPTGPLARALGAAGISWVVAP